jgi:GNAT superfamily N-acetyltransferase
MEANGTQRGEVLIRRAKREDIDDLTMIARSCYPDLLRWQGPRFHGRKRWRLLLDSESNEIWVSLSHGQTAGYFTLILNRQENEAINGKPRPGLFVGLYILATRPKLFINTALKKLKRSSKSGLCRLFGSPSNDGKILPSEKLRRLSEKRVPWVGYTAVAPTMRGKGVATEMLEFCIQRAVELGYREILAYVERSNTGAGALVRKFGFETTEEMGDHFVCRAVVKQAD